MLQEYHNKAKGSMDPWTLDECGLLKHQECLVVIEDRDLRMRLITEAYGQLSMAHPGKNKTRKIIVNYYYWPGMTANIDRYVRNCTACHMATIL